MSNWNFNGKLKENGKRIVTSAKGSVNMIGARESASVSFTNNDGELDMTINIPQGGSGSSGGGGSSSSSVGKITYKGDIPKGEYFNDYEENQALGEKSHAEGKGTLATGDYQHVQGKYNIEDKDNEYADIVGGGLSDSDRRNLSTLDWRGNLTVDGDIFVQGSKEPLIVCLTQDEYDAIDIKNAYTLYLIKEE